MELLRQIVQEIPGTGIFVMDANGNEVYANEKGKQFFDIFEEKEGKQKKLYRIGNYKVISKEIEDEEQKHTIYYIYECNEDRVSEEERQVLLKQLNPHFLFNALNAIKALSVLEPEHAASLVTVFSRHLRYTLKALQEKEGCHLFAKEMDHIECYLQIQKVRFPKIEWEFLLEEKQFMVPMKSILYLVENAVTHGVCQKIDCGKITIKSYQKEGNDVIEVIDTGAGFSTEILQEYKQNQKGGIFYAQKEIENLRNGTLEIISREEMGTKATVILPVQN